MAIDGKYGRVTTERGDIGEDEPVVVFRAQDGQLRHLLNFYWTLCRSAGSPEQHLQLIEQCTATVVKWQDDSANYVKNPPTSGGPAGQVLGLVPD